MSTHTAAPSWQTRAACASRTDLPWLTDAADLDRWAVLTMRAVCDACTVLLDCLAVVDDLDVTGGWWAGQDRDPHAVQLLDAAPSWVPVRTSKRGPIIAQQGAFPLDLTGLPLGGAA
ncbi:hypothetical protein [Arsenicicoccus dermatophilus]|uniref:hypothetical protein n=1 Tax=Arsenicicoccus dermatophilus TaxID=1076331 RepID=UPI0039171DC7